MEHQAGCLVLWLTALLLVGQHGAAAHYAAGAGGNAASGHAGCGHSRVAHQSRFWSQMHTQSMQRARELGIPLGPHPGGSYAAAASSGSAAADAQRTPAPALLGTRSLLQAGSSGEAARNAGAVATLPIRIWVEYQGVNALSASERTKLVETVNITLGVLHKYLRVKRPPSGRLLVPATCIQWDSAGFCNKYSPDLLSQAARGSEINTCGIADMNANHIAPYRQCSVGGGTCQNYTGGVGEFTDYYLYITSQEDEHCAAGAVAWALPCKYSATTNRPILGAANLCPSNMMNSTVDEAVSVLTHELTHALGFTDDSFDKFIDASGDSIPKAQVVTEVNDPYGVKQTFVITPTVKAETQAQFACPTAIGAALENDGGEGSARAHWEYRHFQGELMVATNLFSVYGKPATMSRITLAFLQDSGWYDINWEAAGFLDWGYKAGCDFVDRTCADYISRNPSQNYFCAAADYSDTVNSVCTFNGLGRAKCETAQFAGPCVMKLALWEKYNCLSSQYATSSGDIFGWGNGPDSRCMPVTWLFETQALNGIQYQFPDSANRAGWKDAVCYDTSCTAAGLLQLNIAGSKVDCPSGATVDLARALPARFKRGSIGPCPDNAVICGTKTCPASCQLGGACQDGTCYCDLMFTGTDCTEKLTANGSYAKYVPPPPGTLVDDGAALAATGYLLLQTTMSNSQSEVLAKLDQYKEAVAALAGVTSTRVAVISYSINMPATSLFGGTGRRLTAAAADALAGVAWPRQLLASDAIEVDSRIATIDQADADAISARVADPTLQEAFKQALATAGLTLVEGSIKVTQPSANPLSGGLLDNPMIRLIIIICGAVVGGILLVLLVWWGCKACMNRRRQHPALPPMMASHGMAPPYGGAYNPGGGGGHMTTSASQYPLIQPNGSGTASPAAGSVGRGTYQWPAQAYPQTYTVAGRQFASAEEAEAYGLQLAMQRSMGQQPTPGYGGSPYYPSAPSH